MTPCNHYEDVDFLLDDKNSKQIKCLQCHRLVWNSANSDVGQELNKTYIREDGTTCITEDHNDNLEDSPLLTNDLYEDSEFHCHRILRSSEDVTAWKKLSSAAILCAVFMLAELVGGYLAGSLAVMTDAAHLLSDLIGFLISLLAIWVGRKPPTRSMTFGYYRAEVIGALLSVLTIWILTAILSTMAISRLYTKDYEIEATTMIVISTVGLLVNIIMGGILHGVCHTHSHGLSQHSHSESSSNINVRAATIHVLGDLLQSFGVLVAAVVIKFEPSAKIADPICTLIFSAIVICTTVRVGKDSLWFLLEGSPIDSMQLKNEIAKLEDIKHVHSLHTWALAPEKNIVSVHLAVDDFCDRDVLLKKTALTIQSKMPVISCTIQVESYNDELIKLCGECQNLQW
ncbi:proton-coupled zinc antiporter SLC30A2-like isoform X1 [Diorhabda carinulata]|uniref:proton-coupled zinc antiporter SLC30A2-like isoform X1 n=1 Tax=Diorhabda carinulata TaxID=1163345 RepID=UPI0025A096A6|nr:proton-coupled zinc antiporter SLC30A2-like isoform X1 [Diorhabda carinulata]